MSTPRCVDCVDVRLTPSKRQILISKGILLFGMATIIIGWNLTAIGVGIFLKSDMEWAGRFYEFLWTLGAVGAFGIAAAGTGWCASLAEMEQSCSAASRGASTPPM